MATLASSSAVAATCGSSSVSRASASSTSSPAGLRVANLPLIAGKGASWSSKTVSNGSRVNAFNVVNPDTNTRYETLSYLPPLTENQIFKQIDYLLRENLIPAIEFDKTAVLTRENHKGPGYYEGRYWTLWKLPLFGANDPGQVLREIGEAKRAYPNHYIRVIGFDNKKQVQSISFIVQKGAQA